MKQKCKYWKKNSSWEWCVWLMSYCVLTVVLSRIAQSAKSWLSSDHVEGAFISRLEENLQTLGPLCMWLNPLNYTVWCLCTSVLIGCLSVNFTSLNATFIKAQPILFSSGYQGSFPLYKLVFWNQLPSICNYSTCWQTKGSPYLILSVYRLC